MKLIPTIPDQIVGIWTQANTKDLRQRPEHTCLGEGPKDSQGLGVFAQT